jgi:hypothetical protein
MKERQKTEGAQKTQDRTPTVQKDPLTCPQCGLRLPGVSPPLPAPTPAPPLASPPPAPLLLPSGPRRMVHSSMFPKASKRRRTSSSDCCLLSIPTKSFLSSRTKLGDAYPGRGRGDPGNGGGEGGAWEGAGLSRRGRGLAAGGEGRKT